MSYLLDTCILSKFRKSNPGFQRLNQWLDKHPETSYFISVVSIGEIQMGISKLREKEGEKKIVFERWLLENLIPRFEPRILGIDMHTCFLWGKLRGDAEKRGRPLPAIDALLAATALQHNLILVTDNIKDFEATNVDLFNPMNP